VEDAWCRLTVWTGLSTPLLTVEGELGEVVARVIRGLNARATPAPARLPRRRQWEEGRPPRPLSESVPTDGLAGALLYDCPIPGTQTLAFRRREG